MVFLSGSWRLVVCTAVLLSGCSTIRTLPPPGLTPAHEITVFTDGFHSGLVLDREALGCQIDPIEGDEISKFPDFTLHFGEKAWTDGEDQSLLHAASLAFVPGTGVVQSDHTRSGLMDVPGIHLEHLRLWTFAVNQNGIDHLRRNLRSRWLTGAIMPRGEGETSTLYVSAQSWSLFHNCHDFTFDMLGSAGLDVRRRWLYIAGGLAMDLDQASHELEAAGITVIGY